MIDHLPTRMVLCGIALFFVAWDMVELQVSGIWQIMLCVVQIIAIIATVLIPRGASVALLILDFCSTAFGITYIIPTFSGMFLAIGLLSYETNNWISVGIFATAAGSQAVQQVLLLNGNFLSPPYFAIVVTYALCALAGCMLRFSAQASLSRLQMERSRQELLRMREYTVLSDSIHDRVTGELSLIIRIAQTQLQDRSRNNDLAAWSQTEESAHKALDDIRHIISHLDEMNDVSFMMNKKPVEKPNKKIKQCVGDVIHRREHSLYLAGFRGNCVFTIAQGVDFDNPNILQLVLDVIEEMFANILRHGDPECEYSLSVHINHRVVRITSCNVIRSKEDLFSGHGLDSLSRRIRDYGGDINYGAEGDEYCCYCSIPLSS